MSAVDDAAVTNAANDLRDLMREDQEWQEANEDQIIGSCYDDAAAAYSTAVVYTKGGALQIAEVSRPIDRDQLDYGLSLLGDGLDSFKEAQSLLDDADC